MTVERLIRIIAGSFVMLSVLLAWKVNGVDITKPTWLWFTLFVGANLFQSGFTRFCPMEIFLKKLGFKSGCA